MSCDMISLYKVRNTNLKNISLFFVKRSNLKRAKRVIQLEVLGGGSQPLASDVIFLFVFIFVYHKAISISMEIFLGKLEK